MFNNTENGYFRPKGHRCLLILHEKKKTAYESALQAARYLEEHQYRVDTVNYEKLQEHHCQGYAFALLFGGDGLALTAGVLLINKNLPVLVINLGRVGFMAAFEADGWRKALDKLMAGELILRRHRVLEFTCDGWKTRHFVLNEVFLAAEERFKICEFQLIIGAGDSLGLMRSDGLMISTPTGSTGHALSCGGPLMDTDVRALLILAVNPYTTAYRPLLISEHQSVTVRTAETNRHKILLICDGRCTMTLEPETELQLRLSEYYADFICAENHSFYQTIQKKLGWNAGIIYQRNEA